MLDPETTLFIGLFCGLMIGYAIGTLMWFRRTPRPPEAALTPGAAAPSDPQ